MPSVAQAAGAVRARVATVGLAAIDPLPEKERLTRRKN